MDDLSPIQHTFFRDRASIAECTVEEVIPLLNALVHRVRELEARVEALEAAQSGEGGSEGGEYPDPEDVLSAATYTLLESGGYDTAEQLCRASDEELLGVSHIGRTRLDTIREHFPLTPES